MGTKGRDMALYGYFGGFILFLTAKWVKAGKGWETLSLFVMLASLSILLHYFWIYVPKAKRDSKEAGFCVLVLLPIYRWWANFLLWLAGKKIRAVDMAFEVHVEFEKPENLNTFLNLMSNDLRLMLEKYQNALMMWETHVPLPHIVRKVIRTEQAKGNAFWEKGSWPIPKPPFIYLRLDRKRARYGAGIVPKMSKRGS